MPWASGGKARLRALKRKFKGPYPGTQIKFEFPDVFFTHSCGFHPFALHGVVKHRGDLQQLLHSIAVGLVKFLGVEFYMTFGGLLEEQMNAQLSPSIYAYIPG